ncbi:WGxxGxxG family protein [Nocardia paucivorans]|uniref:WGxxGxxG family protein n=1 Tax=Nocardia paucivorans TaxID=114259 RepID=UPI0012FB4C41|nr:WGxxGxxG family protein [Nocardia paucivorans]
MRKAMAVPITALVITMGGVGAAQAAPTHLTEPVAQATQSADRMAQTTNDPDDNDKDSDKTGLWGLLGLLGLGGLAGLMRRNQPRAVGNSPGVPPRQP